MKKIITVLIIQILIMCNINALEINSKNAILYNLNDNQILYRKNETEKVKIASLTKIMTAIVTLENIEDIKSTTIMSDQAFIDLDGYAKAGFKVGEKVTYEDLLYGLMLPSGAECANQLAISITNKKEDFIKLMNDKALQLGMKNTKFSNTIGIDEEDNYSTAEDIAILLKYALKNEQFKKIFTTKEYITTTNIKLTSTVLERSKPYNIDTSYIKGAKTGFTDEAGYCLASIAEINGINYLLVTTKADTDIPYQIIDAVKIYDYYSKNYSYKQVLTKEQLLYKIPIKQALKKEYKVYSQYDKYIFLNNETDLSKLKYEYEGIKEITKQTKTNEVIGKIKIIENNEVIYEYEVKLNEQIYFHNYILYLVIILFIIFIIKKKTRKNKRK